MKGSAIFLIGREYNHARAALYKSIDDFYYIIDQNNHQGCISYDDELCISEGFFGSTKKTIKKTCTAWDKAFYHMFTLYLGLMV